MSQITDGPRKAFISGETGQANLRWYISDASTSPQTVSICASTNPTVGVNEAAVLVAGDIVTLYLANASGTRKMVAAGAITGGNKVYAANDGEVASTGTLLEGIAFETVTTDQDIIEVMGAFGEDVDEDWADDELLEFGTGDDAVILWSKGDDSNHALVIGIGDTSQQIHITDKDAVATDWNRTAGTHPELAIHSNTTPATDYISIGNHDGTTATIDVVGGTTLNLDIAGTTALAITAAAVTPTGQMIMTSCNLPVTAGVGITGTADNFVSCVEKIGTMFKTTIVVDLDGLNSGGTAHDIIGADGAGVAHLGQITAARNGTIFAGTLTCIETPTGGDPDVDLWDAIEATGVEDTLVTDLTGEHQLCNGGDLSAGTVVPLTVYPVANQYLYLTSEEVTDDTYTAGIIIIELWGK